MLKLPDRIEFRPRRGMARLFAAALLIGGLSLDTVAGNEAAAAEFYKGKTFVVMVASRPGGVAFELSSGPPGMALKPGGRLEWPVPEEFEEKKVNVIVTIRNGKGQSMYESFDLVTR